MRNTLTLRLVLGSSAWIVATLLVAGVLLIWLFRDHIERRFDALLFDHFEELVAASERSAVGDLALTWTPSDPRFNRPRSGWYWQIRDRQTVVAESESLWRARLDARTPEVGSDAEIQEFIGPEGARLRALVQLITLPEADRPFTYIVAGPVTDIEHDVDEFLAKLTGTLSVLGIGLLGTVLIQVRYGLQPLRELRARLVAIRAGQATELPESCPSELQPVLSELNALLDHNTALIERGRNLAGNLAHALKNPLTVLNNEARECPGSQGERIARQVAKMRDYVDRYLSHVRVAGAGGVLGTRSAVGQVVEDLQFLMERVYQGRSLQIRVLGLESLCFQGETQDLEEMLGNLLDNACKWGRHQVLIRGELSNGRLRVAIEDDGDGIPAKRIPEVLHRGHRLDERIPGSGLGLSIARDIAELYQGSLRLESSPLGGLRAVLELPAVC